MIKNINGSKKIIISHIADIDGMGSVVLAKKVFGDIDYILCEVNELTDVFNNEDFSSYEEIFLCDLAISPSAIEVLDNKKEITNKLKHFDHHESYEEKKPDYINTVIEINGKKTCGTELFYNYVKTFAESVNNKFYESFVEATREQDTWDFGKEDYNAKLLASTHALIGSSSYIDLISSLDDSLEFKLPKMFDDLYKADLDNQKRYINYVNDNLLITEYKNYKIGVTIAEQYRSIIGNEICKLRPEIDFLLIINYARNSVSLRCVKDNVDLNQICGEFHHDGGGHRKSAGFIIDSESIPKIKVYNDRYLENIGRKRY